MPDIRESITQLRKWQRHQLLREYGEDGHVLPDNLALSQHLDAVIEAADPGGAVPDSSR